MKYEFRAYDQDYLAYYMLNARQSIDIAKKRKNAFLRSSLMGIAFLVYFVYIYFISYGRDSSMFWFIGAYATYLLIYAVFFMNARYEKFYKKHYKNHIEDNIKSELGRATTIEVIEDKIHLEDETSESKFNISELEVTWETPKHFFIKLLSGTSIIIPKEDIKDIANFKADFNFVNAPIIQFESTEWQSIKDLFFP